VAISKSVSFSSSALALSLVEFAEMPNRSKHVLVRALRRAHAKALRRPSPRKFEALRNAVWNIVAAAREREAAAKLVENRVVALLLNIVTGALRFGGARTTRDRGSRRQCLGCGMALREGLDMASVKRLVIVAVDALEVLARHGGLGTDGPAAAVHVSWTFAQLLLHPHTGCHPELQEDFARAFLALLQGPISLASPARDILMRGPEFHLVRRIVSLVVHGPSRTSSVCASIFAVVAVDPDTAIVFRRLGADKELCPLALASTFEHSIDTAVAALAAFAARSERVFQTPWMEQPMVNLISGLLTGSPTALGIPLARQSHIQRSGSPVVLNQKTQLAIILASSYFHLECAVQYESLMVERDYHVQEEEKCDGLDDVQDEQELSNHTTDIPMARKALRKKVNGIVDFLPPSKEFVGSFRSPVPLAPTCPGDVASVPKEALEAAILEFVKLIQFQDSHHGRAQAVRSLTRIVCGSVVLQEFACGKNTIQIFAQYLKGVQAQCCRDGTCGLLEAVYSSLAFLCIHKGSLASEAEIRSHVLPSVVNSLGHPDPGVSRAAFMCFVTLYRLYGEIGRPDVVSKIQPFLSNILQTESNPGRTWETHLQRHASRTFCRLMMMKIHQSAMVQHDGMGVCVRLLSSKDPVLVVNATRAIEGVGFHSSDTTRKKLLSMYPYDTVEKLSTSQYQEIRKDALLAMITFSTIDSVSAIDTDLGKIRSYMLRNRRRQQSNSTSKISIADVVVNRPPSVEYSSSSSDGQPNSNDVSSQTSQA
jgi:hypothetical protein